MCCILRSPLATRTPLETQEKRTSTALLFLGQCAHGLDQRNDKRIPHGEIAQSFRYPGCPIIREAVAPMGLRRFLRMNIFRVHIVLKVIQTVGRNDAKDLFPYAASRFCITIDDALVDCLMRSFRHCIHTSQ